MNQKDIRLRTNQKSIRLSADSVPSRDEWVKAIRKVMLKAQNNGDSIKVRSFLAVQGRQLIVCGQDRYPISNRR